MEIPQYHCNIKLPVEFRRFEETSTTFVERLCDSSKISKEFLVWLKTMNIGIEYCRYFSSMPHQHYALHVDGDKAHNSGYKCAKINIVFNSTDTTMTWYTPLPGFEAGNSSDNTVNTKIRKWKAEECTVAKVSNVNTHCIIDGSRVHDLLNGANNGAIRECYTMVTKDLSSDRRLTWEDLCIRLSPYLMP